MDRTSTCSLCSEWAPRSLSQIEDRARNIQAHPDLQLHKCPACGSQAWALTKEFIGAPGGVDPGTIPRWWPQWQWLVVAIVIVAVVAWVLWP